MSIKRLPKEVVDRIAAGEVIHRPLNVIKECIENSVDAGAKEVSVFVKNAGYDMIKIQDDGCGINVDDYKILCHRHTTSKLSSVSELVMSGVNTFGFRGEALASISLVSKIRLTSKVGGSAFGYMCNYASGEMVEESAKLTPFEGESGTILHISDLFYNDRKRVLVQTKKHSEFLKIKQLLVRYSINFHGRVSFMFVKSDVKNNKSLQVVVNSQCVSNVKSDLVDYLRGYGFGDKERFFKFSHSCELVSFEGVFCRVSDASSKPDIFGQVVFINDRLVAFKELSNSIKLTFSNVFECVKGAVSKKAYFFFISIRVDPSRVDVNVHSNKSQVLLLNSSEIIDTINSVVYGVFKECSQEIILPKSVQDVAPQKVVPSIEKIFKENHSSVVSTSIANVAPSTNNTLIKVQPKNLVRTSPYDVKLHSFFPSVTNLHKTSRNAHVGVKIDYKYKRNDIELDSINELKQEEGIGQVNCGGGDDSNFCKYLQKCTFVGVTKKRGLIQYETSIVLINIENLLFKTFYQIILSNIGNFDYCNAHTDITSVFDNEQREMFKNYADMFEDYFSIRLHFDGSKVTVVYMPVIISNLDMNKNLLELFFTELVQRFTKDFNKEKAALRTVSQLIAGLYVKSVACNYASEDEYSHYIENVLFNFAKKHVVLSDQFWKENTLVLNNLNGLFKIFERC